MSTPADKGSDFQYTGKIVVAHPSQVAVADQIAAACGDRVVLREICPMTHVYLLDLDKLTKLSDTWTL